MNHNKGTGQRLPHLLRQCDIMVSQYIDLVLKKHQVARSQYRILYHLDRNGGLTQGRLRETLGVKAATVTDLVEVLVRKGLVRRTKTADDRRVNSIELTSRGKRRFSALPDPGAAVESLIRSRLTTAQAKCLIDSLNVITNVLGAENDGRKAEGKKAMKKEPKA